MPSIVIVVAVIGRGCCCGRVSYFLSWLSVLTVVVVVDDVVVVVVVV